MPFQVLTANQLPTDRKAVNDDPNTWTPAIHNRAANRVPSFWPQSGPALSVAAIWGLNQWMEDFSLFLCHYTFQLN